MVASMVSFLVDDVSVVYMLIIEDKVAVVGLIYPPMHILMCIILHISKTCYKVTGLAC